ncbi:MAG: YchJ family protein [Gammaproteobacteria bacterium]|nr:YchJ family protein [Gammaproteobacteria bacterium]
MSSCPCGSGEPFEACCGPIIAGERPAPTAEALMRSRYSAYATGAIDYLHESLHPDHRHDHDLEATRRWAADSEWLGLEVVRVEGGGAGDAEGRVEFRAAYREHETRRVHQEEGLFRRHEGRWFYVDGRLAAPETVRRDAPKVGRNDPCPCGSGKKYKKCCGA